jgi:hypothetical protein
MKCMRTGNVKNWKNNRLLQNCERTITLQTELLTIRYTIKRQSGCKHLTIFRYSCSHFVPVAVVSTSFSKKQSLEFMKQVHHPHVMPHTQTQTLRYTNIQYRIH